MDKNKKKLNPGSEKTIKSVGDEAVNDKKTSKKDLKKAGGKGGDNAAAKGKKSKKIRILFVCTGNTCRSPMAEQLFKQFLRQKKELSLFEVGSAGIYAEEGLKMNSFAEKALSELKVKPKAHQARTLTEKTLENTDFIVCMTAGHKAHIEGCSYVYSVGELTGASDVPDPYGGDFDRYLAVAKYLEYACADIYNAVIKLKT